MSGGSQTTKSKQQALIDPNAYQAIWGAGASQPQFNTKGQIKPGTGATAPQSGGGQMFAGGTPGFYSVSPGGMASGSAGMLRDPAAMSGPPQYGPFSQPGPTGTGNMASPFNNNGGLDPSTGIAGNARNLAANPALNDLQQEALQQSASYLGGPAALAGYNSLNQVGNQLQNFSNPYAGGLPQVNAAQGNLANFNPGSPIDFLGVQRAIASTFAPQPIQAPTVGGSSLNYQDAGNRILSGKVDNPYLQGIAQGSADLATQNFMRNVAPQLRGGALLAGQFGGAKQGVMEGIAAGDLNRDILNSTNQLFGGAYENAQNRMGNLTGQLAGIDAQAAQANAAMQMQAALAQQQGNLAAGQLGLSTAMGMGNYGLGFGGLGLDAASLQQGGSLANAGMLNQVGLGNQDAWLRGQSLNMQGADMANQTRLRGAEAIAGAANIPVQNLQGIYNVGQTVQQAPWQQLGQYANIMNPYMQLGQAQLGTQKTQESMGTGQILGGLASLGLGAMSGGLIPGLGAAGGAAAGGANRMTWSDRRLKTDIERVGTTDGGTALYKFRYIWGGPLQIGVMADEVPYATVRVGGYDMVDYSKII